MNQNTHAFENPDNQNDQRLNKEHQLNNELTRKNFSINNSPPFLDIIPQMVSYTNKDLKYEYVNKAYEQYFNLRASEIIGKKLVDIIGENVLQKAKKYIDNVLHGEEVKYFEKFDYPKGMTRYIEGHLIPDIDKSGNAKGYWAILNDVTDKYEVEKRLKENKEKYRFLYESSPLPYQSLDETGRFIEVNATWLHTLGYEKKEVIGKPFMDFLHPADQHVFTNRFPIFIQRGYVHDYQFRIKHKRGHYLDVSYEGRIEYWPDGNVRQTNCIFKDITEQKNIVEAYQTLVENSFQGLVIMQHEKVVFANSAIAGITGYSLDELYALSWERIVGIIHPDDRSQVMHKLNKLIQGHEKTRHNSFRITHKNGSIRWVEVFFSLINYKSNPAIQVAYIDITDRKKSEEALKESEKQKKLILDSSAEMIACYDLDLKVIWSNKASGISVGKPPEEIVGMHCYEIWQQRKSTCENCPVLKVLEEKKPQSAYQRTPDGRYWFLRAYPVYDENDNIIALAEFGRDITEERKKEKALREREDLFRTVFDTELFAMAISRYQDGMYLEANPGFLKLTGYSREEIIGRTSVELKFFNDAQRKELIHQLENYGYIQNQELTFPTKWGKPRNILFSLGHVTIDNNHRLLSTMVDITDWKKQEKMVAESKLRYEKLLEESPAGIVLFVNKKPELINNKLLEITGYDSFEEFKNNTLYDFIHPGDHFMVRARLDAIQNGTISYPLSSNYRIIRKDGTIRHIAEFSSQFIIHNKTYTQSIIQDITDIIETEKSKRKLAGETAYVERKLQLLKQVESELKRVIEESKYEMDQFNSVLALIKNEIEFDRHWQIFKENFESIHSGFFRKLTLLSPKLTQQDIKHCALIKMNFETKEIAAMFNIKPSSVQISRVRLKKKLGLPPEEDLIRYIINL